MSTKTIFLLVFFSTIFLSLFIQNSSVLTATPQCSDGIDNDLDGKVDYPNDIGCSGTGDGQEFNILPPPGGDIKAGGLLWYPDYGNNLGPNLLANSGFETLTSGKLANWEGSYTVDNNVSHSGNRSIRFNFGGGSLTPVSQKINLKKGVYRFSFWIKTSNMGSDASKGIFVALKGRNVDADGGGHTTADMRQNGTTNWHYIENIGTVVTQDGEVRLEINNTTPTSGTAWIDDMRLREERPLPINVFLTYPNYRGMLFDDLPQTIKFQVSVNPPGGIPLSGYKVNIMLINEANNATVSQKTFAAKSKFTAEFDGTSLVNGKTYIARFKLIRKSDNAFLYEYPSYRISKVSGTKRTSMTFSFDQHNRLLMRGKPTFILGMEDNKVTSSKTADGWENSLTTERRLFEMPLNIENITWFSGDKGIIRIDALCDALGRHDVFYIKNVQCLWRNYVRKSDPGNTKRSFIESISGHPNFAGFKNMDECYPELAPEVFDKYLNYHRKFDPDGVTFGVANKASQLFYWRDIIDFPVVDCYPIRNKKPYPLEWIAGRVRAIPEEIRKYRPFGVQLQFMKHHTASQWPTKDELRNMSYIAITEGANGLFYYSIGEHPDATQELPSVCQPGASNPDSTIWCAERVEYHERLKAVMNELRGIDAALTSVDRPDLLVGNNNPNNIPTRVKFVNGKGYLFAYNYTSTNKTATFTWEQTPTNVSVYKENRSVPVSGASFTDSFGPYKAHVYVISTAP